MAGKQKYTVQQVTLAIRRNKGLLTYAAEQLGCAEETIYNYMRRYPSVTAAVKRERERTKDIAELKLFEAIQAGEPWAIQFYLKTQGKTRGYVERQELTGADGEDLGPRTIQLYWSEQEAEPTVYLPYKNGTAPYGGNGHAPAITTRSATDDPSQAPASLPELASGKVPMVQTSVAPQTLANLPARHGNPPIPRRGWKPF
jgi:hypothetical protein